MDTLFRITHSGTFNISIQALGLIYQVTSAREVRLRPPPSRLSFQPSDLRSLPPSAVRLGPILPNALRLATRPSASFVLQTGHVP